MYLDPPYLFSTRSRTDHRYTHEANDSDHERFAEVAHQLESYCVVSGYRSELYADLYELHGWQRIERVANTNGGGKRVECLWLSPRTQKALGYMKSRQVLL